MISLELTQDELRLIRNALNALLADFGHNEHDILHQIKDLLVKIAPVTE
jgi:hypothetical protein